MATGWTIVKDLMNELGLYLVMMEIEINLKTSKDEEVHSIEERVAERINDDVFMRSKHHIWMLILEESSYVVVLGTSRSLNYVGSRSLATPTEL